MGNTLIAFLVAISAATWIYSKMMRNTGGLTKSALTVAAISGVLVFVLVLILIGLIPN